MALQDYAYFLRVSNHFRVLYRFSIDDVIAVLEDKVAFYHACARRYAFLRRMVLNVPRGRVHRLPNSRQVGLAVAGAWQSRPRRSLSAPSGRFGDRYLAQRQQRYEEG